MMFDIFSIVPFFITVVFIILIGTIIIRAIRFGAQTYSNSQAPVNQVLATIVDKRSDVSYHHHGDNGGSTSSTTYYVTFQLENGDRHEFRVKGKLFGHLVVGDYGRLTYQGTWYQDFQRMAQ